MIRVLLLLLGLAGPATAEVASVTTGEHAGFTRIVLTFPSPSRWSLRRDTDGYVLDAATADLRYDLSRVFDRIPRDRLSAVWAEPDTGALRLKVGCACHAMAFDLRPGLLVIDLRDGPPPADSPFEAAVGGGGLPALTAQAPRRPLRRPPETAPRDGAPRDGYDWLVSRNQLPASPPAKASVTPAHPPPAVAMADEAALRGAMLEHLARGAALGVVEMALPETKDAAEAQTMEPMEQVQIYGEAGIGLRTGKTTTALTGEGSACPGDVALALAEWGDEKPVAEALSRRTAALTGEFDRPDPTATARAVRYLLYLGFGAEARQIMQVMALDTPERPLWEGLTHLLDDEADPADAFAGMEVCDGSAALWAVLSAHDLPPGASTQRAAVLRAFSALPLHLRRDLGPRLADRFLDAEDLGAARAVQDAILRAPGDAGPGAALMATRLDAAEGQPVSAARLDALETAPGSVGVEATLMAVEAALKVSTPPDPALAASVEALLREYAGAEEAPALRRAAALLRALGGDEPGAFALADEAVTLEIWQVLADHGGDGALLEAAVGTTPPGALPLAVRRTIATRLLGLGLPDPALAWLPRGEGASDLVIAARAHLAKGDGRTALRLIGGRDLPEAAALRAKAMQQLGDPSAVAAFAALEDGEGLERARRATGDWAAVAAGDTDVWTEAAALAVPASPVPDEGPLARSTRLIAEADAARSRIASLLAATAPTP